MKTLVLCMLLSVGILVEVGTRMALSQSIPEPVPPVYTHLKDLHLTTALVHAGQPQITLLVPASGVYDTLAARVQQTIKGITGTTVPIAPDTSAAGAVPLRGPLIAFGNRSTNQTIEELYNRYYCILDLKYPGPGGYTVRSLHNPFGDGHNVIFLGGSDLAGVEAATDAFCALLPRAGGATGELSVGHLMEIKLGANLKLEGLPHWDDGHSGEYGWCSVSELMAAYYMTGEREYAREMLRYAFPDDETRAELRRRDYAEYQDSPIAAMNHYALHYLDLLWDLIEESPVFSDEERLQVTNAMARQLSKRTREGIYRLTPENVHVEHEDMHACHSALCLYVLGRYFQKDYPNPIWEQCLRGAHLYFDSLHKDARFAAGVDNLIWHNTEIQPTLTYMLLTGWREPLGTGALQDLLRGQEIITSGLPDEWAHRWSSLAYLNKAAYLLQDGRWGTYRDRLGLDTNLLRLGQSFWPEEHLPPVPPTDLVNTWSVRYLPEAHRLARGTGFSPTEAFYFGSFRSAPDAGGDYILLDGYNGEGRNPYHAFSVSELRLDGRTVLKGYRNQVLVSADGLLEPRLALDGALKQTEVVGDVALAVGEVPQLSWATWRRSLAQRVGQYTLFVDAVTFRTSSENMSVETLWETTGDQWAPARACLELMADDGTPFEVHTSEPLEYRRESVSRLEWHGPAKQGERQMRFSLLAKRPQTGALRCRRVAENAAALALPQPALAVAGSYEQLAGELVVLAQDHLFGLRVTQAGVGEQLFSASAPTNVMWDFTRGILEIVASKPVEVAVTAEGPGPRRLKCGPGRHRWEGLRPPSARLARLRAALEEQLARGDAEWARAKAAAGMAQHAAPAAPALPVVFTATVGECVAHRASSVAYSGSDHVQTGDAGSKLADLRVVPLPDGPVIHLAAGNEVYRVRPDGSQLPPLQAEGDIRVLHWWPEPQLLLTGGVDGKVIAFDAQGQRRWEFQEQKDPAFYGPGDDGPFTWNMYWRGTEGVHGLYSGVFLEGKSQAFVGSTNTLEILDEHGALVKKLPILRGMVRRFAMTTRGDGRIKLLMGRDPSDWEALTVLDNVDLQPEIEGFHRPVPGQKEIWAWMQMRPVFLAAQDVDGDGKQEVVAVIDGVWNRAAVWQADQTPVAAANFPPGEGGQVYRNLPGADLADLDGDGTMEIVVATASRVLVVLNHACQRLWSRRLPAVPTVLKTVPASGTAAARIVVGCVDGSVVAYDGTGQVTGQARMEGRPVLAELLPTAQGAHVVLGADQGQIAGFAP